MEYNEMSGFVDMSTTCSSRVDWTKSLRLTCLFLLSGDKLFKQKYTPRYHWTTNRTCVKMGLGMWKSTFITIVKSHCLLFWNDCKQSCPMAQIINKAEVKLYSLRIIYGIRCQIKLAQYMQVYHTRQGKMWARLIAQIAKFMGPTWAPPGPCRHQIGPILAPWTLLSCG